MAMYSLESLNVYKECVSYRKDVRPYIKQLPKNEKYLLADQMIRASRSASANIAEGYGRYHYQEFIQYCRNARGSISEMKDHWLCAFEEEYIDELNYKEWFERSESLIKLINGFIKYLRAQKAKKGNERDL